MTMPRSLRDRISKRLQARSLSSRYGDFTFDSSPRRRRRNGRYSSVCMSSAESTPLFNIPAPSQEQKILGAKSQPSSWRSAIDPLATSSLMLATVELDRLTNRRVPDRSSEVLGSGQSSACGGPPNSPAMKSLAPGERSSSRQNTTSYATESSIAPRNPLSLEMTMRSGNSMSQSTAKGQRRQMKTSSRFSDIRTTENIPEASDEDVSPMTCTPGELCTPNLDSSSQTLYSPLTIPTDISQNSCTGVSEAGLSGVAGDRIAEQTRLTQDDPSRGFLTSISAQTDWTPDLNEEMSLSNSGQPRTRKSPAHHLHTGALTPQSTRGLWCPSRKSLSPPRRQSIWSPETTTGHSNA